MRLLGGCGDTATGAVGRRRVGRTALRGASLGPAHLEAPANRPLDDGEFLQVLHVAEQAVLPEIHRDAGGGRRWMHGPPRGAPSPAGPSGPGMPDARSPAPPTRRTLWSRSWPRASGARGRGWREIERGGSPRAQRAEGAGWVEGAGRAEGAGSEKGAASAAASVPPPPPDRRGCARLRTQLPRNDAPRSGSHGPRPALKGRAPPLGACAELSASPGGREAGWGRGMGSGRLSQ